MTLGQSGRRVLIYVECKQVGLIDYVQPAFVSLELLFGFLCFLESVCPFKSGTNKNPMSFTKQSLTFPYVSLNLIQFPSVDDPAQPLSHP